MSVLLSLFAWLCGGFGAACFMLDALERRTTPRTLLGLLCLNVVVIAAIWRQ